MNKLIISVVFILFSLADSPAQIISYNISQIAELQRKEQRPVLIMLYTDWCRYCKAMENTTFKNEEIINQLNKVYYFLKFDAESKEEIVFQGNTYSFVPTGKDTGLHELAEKIGRVDEQVNFPVLIFMNNQLEVKHRSVGYIKASTLEKMLESFLRSN